jgi:hypothetical protein
MNGQRTFLIRMIAFLVVVVGVIAALFVTLIDAFTANPLLNGVILGVLIIGVAFSFRRVLSLAPDIDWLFAMKRQPSAPAPARSPRLLAPLATMFEDRNRRVSLSAVNMRSVLDGIGSRMEESREIARYLVGLLIFLGLLGTFWGLLQTISSVGDVIGGLSVGASNDMASVFDDLKGGLERPLEGMGTAFSSSLFGLAGSLVLGFLELQASQAQNRFYNDLEDWLSGHTRLSGGAGGVEHTESVPAYVSALLEKTADSLDDLQRTLGRGEESRSTSSANMLSLAERLATLTDSMRSEQDLMVKLVENQLEMRPVLEKLAAGAARPTGLDEGSRTHLRNLDVYMARMLEEVSSGREQIISEMRSEIKMLARTIAAIAEEERR